MIRRVFVSLATLVCLLFLVSPLAAQISDIEAPKLVSISFTPASIDVQSLPRTVTVTAEITDNLSGVNYGYVSFYSPTRAEYFLAYLYRVSGNSLAGVYTGTAVFLPGIESGNWLLDNFYAYDMAGNRRDLSGATLAAIQPARTVSVTSNPDDTKPQITGLRITPPSIDVSAGDQEITIEMDIEDDVVGLTTNATYSYSPILKSPTGQQRIYGGGRLWTVLPGGTPTHATWRMPLVIPKSSAGGIWSIESIVQWDVLNRRWAWSTAELSAAGLDPNFLVVSTNPDVTPPTISDIAVSPGFVNTTLAAQQVTIGLKLADTGGAGITVEPYNTTVTMTYGPFFRSPSQQQYAAVNPFVNPNRYQLVGGTVQNGTWQGSFTLPRYAEAGTWSIDFIQFRDRANNTVYLGRSQIEAMGLQRTIVVTQPTGTPDNVINPALGGTVADDVFGAKAQITAAPGVLPSQTTVSIDVFQSPLGTPTPRGFSAPGTLFVNIALNPHPVAPLPPPGLTVTVPVAGNLVPGTVLKLYRVDPATGTLLPARHVNGSNEVSGAVDPGGETATFTGIASFSTVVGLVPSGTPVGDADLNGVVNCADYVTVKQAFGRRRGQPGYLAGADLNNDGVISITDLMVLARLLPGGCPGM